MTDELHITDLLPAYAIGSLDEAEARQVSEHLSACYLCRQELAAYQAVADQLAWTAVPTDVAPSPDLKRRLMERLPTETRPAPARPERGLLPRWVPAGGFVAVLLLALLGLSNLFLWQKLQDLEMLSGPHGMRAIVMQSTDAEPQASAFLIIGADGQNGVLVVDELPPPPEGQEYQLWLTRDGYDDSGAVFDVDETGYRGLRVQAPQSLLTYATAKVTIEPVGGSTAPTGQEVFRATLFNP